MNAFGLDKKYEEFNFEEVSVDELEIISGGSGSEGMVNASLASGIAFGIGMAAFGSSWGVVGVGIAFASAPIAVAAMVGLAAYAGYSAGSSTHFG